jgi:hypothetical protein
MTDSLAWEEKPPPSKGGEGLLLCEPPSAMPWSNQSPLPTDSLLWWRYSSWLKAICFP